jgi:hypothetical protein
VNFACLPSLCFFFVFSEFSAMISSRSPTFIVCSKSGSSFSVRVVVVSLPENRDLEFQVWNAGDLDHFALEKPITDIDIGQQGSR